MSHSSVGSCASAMGIMPHYAFPGRHGQFVVDCDRSVFARKRAHRTANRLFRPRKGPWDRSPGGARGVNCNWREPASWKARDPVRQDSGNSGRKPPPHNLKNPKTPSIVTDKVQEEFKGGRCETEIRERPRAPPRSPVRGSGSCGVRAIPPARTAEKHTKHCLNALKTHQTETDPALLRGPPEFAGVGPAASSSLSDPSIDGPFGDLQATQIGKATDSVSQCPFDHSTSWHLKRF